MKVLCVICARKGSKGIKNKNLIKIKKKRLIDFTINHAIKSKVFSNIVVSTDSKIIQKHVNSKDKLSWFLRPKLLSTDKASKLDAIIHALLMSEERFGFKFDYVCDLDVTAPLRKISDIKKAFLKFKKNNYDVLFSVTDAKKNPYFNIVEKKTGQLNLIKKFKKKIVSRQQAPKVYEMNASFYFWKRNSILKKKRFGKKVGFFEMPRYRSIDIDDNLDLEIVKKII